MRLYIAEKPSMGREIAKILGAPGRKGDGFLETPNGVVTWGFGHILRQAEPEEYDEKYKKWRTEDLPIVPREWKLMVAESCRKQFGIVKGLIERADEIVHAGDPDREGQLLIDEVLEYVGNKKPVLRILLNALDEKSIREANADLRDNKDFAHLKESALARARADWLIGMNLSRAYTLAARRAGHDMTLPIGRVKTPTLALVVRREREIKDFHPVAYYTIKANFNHENGSFDAVWKPKESQKGLDSEGRLVDKAEAESMLQAFASANTDGVISSYQTTAKKEPQRLPFSLSSLQVLAGKRFGYDPQQVLDTAQELYEKKLTSYPRSDCEYLPKNQIPASKAILKNLTGIDDEQLKGWAAGADGSIRSRAWNDKKITAHHAIIPTTVRVQLSSLTPMQRDIYFLIAQAYLAQFYPEHTYDQTKINVRYAGELFAASGRVVKEPGWKALYSGKQAEKDDEKEEDSTQLPQMKKQDAVQYKNGKMDEKETKPPQRFTPSTLLAAMKDIHKYVKDAEAKKQLKDVSGIGTEATRASIIDDLIKRKFLKQQGKKKYLIPQPSAELLVDALPDDMTYPDKTAVWEDELHSMAAGNGTIDAFLKEQEDFARRLCEKAFGVKMEVKGEYPCPRCHQGIMTKRHGKNGDFWGCTNFPRCRMTCDDVDGKPDLEGASRRSASRAGHTAAPVYNAPPSDSFMMSDEEMAAFTAQYQPELSAQAFLSTTAVPKVRKWGTEPKPSAAPMEHMEKAKEKSPWLCPHCREGSLQLVHGRNGDFWGCTNYPNCTATYDDDKGRPVLP